MAIFWVDNKLVFSDTPQDLPDVNQMFFCCLRKNNYVVHLNGDPVQSVHNFNHTSLEDTSHGLKPERCPCKHALLAFVRECHQWLTVVRERQAVITLVLGQ